MIKMTFLARPCLETDARQLALSSQAGVVLAFHLFVLQLLVEMATTLILKSAMTETQFQEMVVLQTAWE